MTMRSGADAGKSVSLFSSYSLNVILPVVMLKLIVYKCNFTLFNIARW